jgi:hypothetical protein
MPDGYKGEAHLDDPTSGSEASGSTYVRRVSNEGSTAYALWEMVRDGETRKWRA